MSNSFVLDGGNQQRCEQDVGHLPVEQVHPVVGLRHHGGVVSARGVVLHALPTTPQQQRTQTGAREEKSKVLTI